jgi:hypothetical protein
LAPSTDTSRNAWRIRVDLYQKIIFTDKSRHACSAGTVKDVQDKIKIYDQHLATAKNQVNTTCFNVLPARAAITTGASLAPAAAKAAPPTIVVDNSIKNEEGSYVVSLDHHQTN